MIKYLQEIKSRFCLFQVPYINEILAELEKYQKIYSKYENSKDNSIIYPKEKPEFWDKHHFPICPEENRFYDIVWDIGYIYDNFMSKNSITKMTLLEFKDKYNADIIASRATFLDIQQYLQPNYPHEFDSILTAIYNPYGSDATLILDGRHRYMEALLFHPSATLPVITLNTDDIMSAIVDTKSLLNYIIMRNIKTMNDCAMFRKPLSGLLSLSDYGFCL